MPGYQCANWIGLVAPAGTPEPIVARLHKELAAIQDTPELQKQFANEGAEVVRISPAEFGAFIASEPPSGARWSRKPASRRSKKSPPRAEGFCFVVRDTR